MCQCISMYFFSAVSMFTKTRLSIVPLLFCSKRRNTLYIITLYSHRWQCGISMTSFPIRQTAVRSGVYMLSIMCSSFCYFYTSLYLLSLYIYFLICESHIKESTIKVYYKFYLSCWIRKTQRPTQFSSQLDKLFSKKNI